MTLTLVDLPEVSFAKKDIELILSDMITGYEEAYFESTKIRKKLYPGDPIRIWLYTQALRELQLRIMIDDSAKQNLLKYSREGSLDNLGAFSRTDRFQATRSRARVLFTLSGARPTTELIPSGTRVSPGAEIYFATIQDTTIPAGAIEIEVETESLEVGTLGNGFSIGQINILVDPLPWLNGVSNVEESYGGTDVESDDSFRERIHLAPEGFSVAGPDGAYEYFTRKFSPLISDVRITSPSPGIVDVKVLLQGGDIPSQTFLDDLDGYLSAKERRPLTDNVVVGGPTTVTYNLDVTYYIRSSDSKTEEMIKLKIDEAIQDYVTWQRSKIGRDINPSELMAKMILAGAKRAEIISPSFTEILNSEIAIIGLENVVYGGLENE